MSKNHKHRECRVVDTFATTNHHEMFNATLLSMCMHIFDVVESIRDRSSYQCIYEILKHDLSLDFSKIKQTNINAVSLNGFCGYMKGALKDVSYLFTAPRNTVIIYSDYYNMFSLWGINLFNYVLRRKIVMFCHGGLDVLRIENDKLSRVDRVRKLMQGWLFKYGRIHNKVKLCVLGDSILSNLQPYLNNHNKKNFFAIDHAYYFDAANKRHERNDSLTIATIGYMNFDKGYQQLFDIANELTGELTLSVIGRVNVNCQSHPNLNVPYNGNMIPREAFGREIEKLDYILFLYPADSYKLYASGAIFDVLAKSKPVIAFHNDYFDYMMKLPIGYVVDSTEEMISLIRRLNKDDAENKDYDMFLGNIEKLKQYYTVEAVGKTFETQLKLAFEI